MLMGLVSGTSTEAESHLQDRRGQKRLNTKLLTSGLPLACMQSLTWSRNGKNSRHMLLLLSHRLNPLY